MKEIIKPITAARSESERERRVFLKMNKKNIGQKYGRRIATEYVTELLHQIMSWQNPTVSLMQGFELKFWQTQWQSLPLSQ